MDAATYVTQLRAQGESCESIIARSFADGVPLGDLIPVLLTIYHDETVAGELRSQGVPVILCPSTLYFIDYQRFLGDPQSRIIAENRPLSMFKRADFTDVNT